MKKILFVTPIAEDRRARFTEIAAAGGAELTFLDREAVTDDDLRDAAQGIATGEMDVRTFVDRFHTRLPFVPLYYAADALAVSTRVPGIFGSSASELYAGIENWSLQN